MEHSAGHSYYSAADQSASTAPLSQGGANPTEEEGKGKLSPNISSGMETAALQHIQKIDRPALWAFPPAILQGMVERALPPLQSCGTWKEGHCLGNLPLLVLLWGKIFCRRRVGMAWQIARNGKQRRPLRYHHSPLWHKEHTALSALHNIFWVHHKLYKKYKFRNKILCVNNTFYVL